MALNDPLPDPPGSDYLQWVVEHPEALLAYLQKVKGLDQLTVNYVVGGVTKQARIQFSGQNSSITLNIS